MQTPRTIVFFDHTALMSGAEIGLLDLVRVLDRKSFLPVVVLASEGRLHEKLEAAGVETHVIPLANDVVQTRKDTLHGKGLLRPRAAWRSLLYAWRLSRFLRQRGADLVHANSLKADIIGGAAAVLAGVPVLWHIHDRIVPEYLPRAAVAAFRWLSAWLPDHLVVNSYATLRTLNLKDGRATVVYVGQADSAIDDGQPDRTAATRVGLVGRLAPWKGQHVFIDAAAQVRERFPRVKFQIIGAALFGEQAYERQVRSQAHALGLDDVLEFTGHRDDVLHVISELSILVHASTTGEPFGQVVVQGMMAGKPVVATDGGAIPEIIQHGKTGLLVPMGDAAGMAEAVCELLANPQRASAMGQAGRQRAQSCFSIERTASDMQRVYRRMLRRSSDSLSPWQPAEGSGATV